MRRRGQKMELFLPAYAKLRILVSRSVMPYRRAICGVLGNCWMCTGSRRSGSRKEYLIPRSMLGMSSQREMERLGGKSPAQEEGAFSCSTAKRTRPGCGRRCAGPGFANSNSDLILKEAKW